MALKKPAAVEGVNFGDLESGLYSHGGNFDLAEGDYVFENLELMLFTGFNTEKPTDPRLGVMITIKNLEDPDSPVLTTAGEPHEGRMFYSMGSKASLAFAPDETGKGLRAVPGGNGKIPDSTNWVMLVKSLADAGLPKGILTNDISVLEGTHVHMMNVPEPAERKGFKAKTGDAQTEERNFTRNVAIVSEIKDDGKPWEGTGGVPDSKPKGKGPVKVPAKTAAKPAPKEEAEEEAELTDDTVRAIALGGLAECLESVGKVGAPKSSLKLNAAKKIKASAGEEAMSAAAGLFETDKGLQSLLDELGFTISGAMVKPV